ncbi:MAG: rhomboid family intramembrane serine protease, partial [Planctomycetes bacterium]|nr:rhomboid family intramembrane serine protease [Planctomycetota bacterium]
AVVRRAQKVGEMAHRPIHVRPRSAAAIEREEEWSAPVIVSALTGIPVEVDNPLRRTPWVTWSLIAINVIVYILQIASGNPEHFIKTWGMSPRAVLEGERLITIFTSMFVHANILHLLGNMVFLYIFADNVEDRCGSYAFAFLYVIFGLAANAVDLLLFPTRTVVGVGASGAISGAMGCYLAFFPRSQLVTVFWFLFRPIAFRVSAWLYLGVWILFQALAAAGQGPGGGVNYVAHVAGFATGLATGLALGLILRTLEGPEEKRPAGTRIR